MRKITVRVDNTTYQQLETLANQRGEPVSVVIRKLLVTNLENEIALGAQDVLITAVRKAVGRELRQVENRLGNLAAKAAITSASAENVALYVVQLLKEPNVKGVKNTSRKRAVSYVREPLDQIIQTYEGDDN